MVTSEKVWCSGVEGKHVTLAVLVRDALRYNTKDMWYGGSRRGETRREEKRSENRSSERSMNRERERES